jgi:hypothetical protein
MFGLLVGKLDKARTEDKEKCATAVVRSIFVYLGSSDCSSGVVISVQAKKRQTIEQRLQGTLKKETDFVRRTGAQKEKQEFRFRDTTV